jgi:aryl-alcohol dehydrogenase-like predicted oxidoreductase
MEYRPFGRLGWPASVLGHGMWGLANWSGSDDDESREALREAARLGVTFFDTAWAYGAGKSERMLGELVREFPGRRLTTASKIPPKNGQWPPRRGTPVDDVFPPDHIRAFAERTLENLHLSRVDLLQFHVWQDEWARDEGWQRAVRALRDEGMAGAIGVSVNRWEPVNVLDTLETGLVDAVQVIYNVFDQAPEDELFPRCRELGVAVIARVPFDEGSLSGAVRRESRFPEGDFRRIYFGEENLGPTMDRVDALREATGEAMPLAELALRFIVSNGDVATVIPGMRRVAHVRANVAAVERGPLDVAQREALRAHRWDRVPTAWSL